MIDAPRFPTARNPFDTERRRGHRIVGPQPRGPRERHYIAAIATVIASAVSAYATYEQSQAQAAAARYNQKVQENSAIAAQQAASVAAHQERERVKRINASNLAAVGASGLTTEGSPLMVMMDTAQQGELNARLIESGGQRQAAQYTAEARLQGFYGDQARTAGYIGAGSTLLTGLANGGRLYAAANNPPSSNPYGPM